MDEALLKEAQERTQQRIALRQQEAQKLNGLPKPRSLAEVSAERRAERELEAIAPSTGYPDLDQIVKGFVPGHLITMTGNTNVGKCLGFGTEIMMADGSIKQVQDIVGGDLLMGPDNLPRRVLSTTTGEDEMYLIKQQWGRPYVVNKDHVLSLKCSTVARKYYKEYEKGKVVNISVADYLKQSGNFKKFTRGWSVPVDFPQQKVLVDPYFLGVWLGDGHTNSVSISTKDPEIVAAVSEYGTSLGLETKIRNDRTCIDVRITSGKTGNHQNTLSLQKMLRQIGVLGAKHIPESYRVNSRDVRLQLLAGIIDTDGWVQKNTSEKTGKDCYSYAVSITNKGLAEDILLLVRSLGLNAKINTKTARLKRDGLPIYEVPCYTVSIQGDLTQIPVRVPRKKIVSIRTKAVGFSSFEVIPQGRGVYYGFTLEGDGLFLLADCTVTHNTTVACNFAIRVAKQGKKVLYLALEPENMIIEYLASVRTDKTFEEVTDEDREFDDGNIHIFGKQEIPTLQTMIDTIDHLERYDLVIIDHIGYFTTGDSQNFIQEQSNAVKKLVALAKRKQSCVLAIAHLRKNATWKKRIITQDDISGSAAFKQDSTEVFIVVREVLNEETGELADQGILMVTKTKAGPNGIVNLTFSPRKANITSIGEQMAKARQSAAKDNWVPEARKLDDKW